MPPPTEPRVPHAAVDGHLTEPAGSVHLAFVAALQLLTPRERAVLVLREILRWPVTDVAALLETSIASITRALDLARSTIASSVGTNDSISNEQRELLTRYVDAFEGYDLESLTPLLSR